MPVFVKNNGENMPLSGYLAQKSNPGIIEHKFNDAVIPQRKKDGYFHGTAMCKAVGKFFGSYVASNQTKDFLAGLSASMGISVNGLVQAKTGPMANGGGTWVHPKVAINLANWLSPQLGAHVVSWATAGLGQTPAPIPTTTPTPIPTIENAIDTMPQQSIPQKAMYYKGVPVVTTAQLAGFYECDPKNLKDNFNQNTARFKVGSHYFKLEGQELSEFKDKCAVSNGSLFKQVANLMLWTERGAALHAKILKTDKAWDAFETMFSTNLQQITTADGASMTPVISHTFNNSVVQQRATDGYINATAMCKAAGKLWGHYSANQQTKDFLTELSSAIGITIAGLVQSKEGNALSGAGTWVHPQVAINLAQWLSPKFAVQVTAWVLNWLGGGKTPDPVTAPVETPALDSKVLCHIKMFLGAAELLGAPVHYAQVQAVRQIREKYDVDLAPLLLEAPAQNNVIASELMLEPTELGATMGMTAIMCNKALAAAGLQVKKGGNWVPTPQGTPYAQIHPWVKGSKSGYNLKWKAAVAQVLKPSNV